MGVFSKIIATGNPLAGVNSRSVKSVYETAQNVVDLGVEYHDKYRKIKDQNKVWIDKLKNIKKPANFLYFTDLLLRDKYVPIPPDNRGTSSPNSIKEFIINGITASKGSSPYTKRGLENANRNTDNLTKLTHIKPDNLSGVNSEYSGVINSDFDQASLSYSKPALFQSIEDHIQLNSKIKDKSNRNYSFIADGDDRTEFKNPNEIFERNPHLMTSWKTVEGFSFDSSNVWELTMKPYYPNPDVSTGIDPRVITPPMPKVQIGSKEFDYSKWSPAISYNYSIGNLRNMNIELFNEASFTVPLGVQYQNKLTVNFLDDRDQTLKKYFQHYYNEIYDPKTRAVAPFRYACFEINLYSFRTDRRLLTKFSLICIPESYNVVVEGDDSETASVLNVAFSVVGAITKYDNESFFKNSGTKSERNLNGYRDVTLVDGLTINTR